MASGTLEGPIPTPIRKSSSEGRKKKILPLRLHGPVARTMEKVEGKASNFVNIFGGDISLSRGGSPSLLHNVFILGFDGGVWSTTMLATWAKQSIWTNLNTPIAKKGGLPGLSFPNPQTDHRPMYTGVLCPARRIRGRAYRYKTGKTKGERTVL